MGEDLEPLTVEPLPPPGLSESKMMYTMAVIIAAGAIIGTVFFGYRFGIGVVFGGGSSYANYFWQKSSTRSLFESVVSGRKPTFLAVTYLLRYVAIGLFVSFFYFTSLLPVAAIILGLASFALAVVVEGLKGIFTTSNNQEL